VSVKTYIKDIDSYGIVCGFAYLMVEREIAGMNAQKVLIKGKQVVPMPMALVAIEQGFVIGPVEKMRPVWDDELEAQIRAEEAAAAGGPGISPEDRAQEVEAEAAGFTSIDDAVEATKTA